MGYDRLSDFPAPLASLRDIYTHPFHNFSYCKIYLIRARAMDVNSTAIAVDDQNVYPILIKG